MATWTGWVNQFLNAAGLLITPPNRTFLEEWAKHAPGSCRNNPVDLTHTVPGSTRCGDTVGGFGRSQNYPSHAAAAHAFALSINSTLAAPIKAALNTGNPFQISSRDSAIAALRQWGSPTFAAWYQSATVDGGGGGGGGGGGRGTTAHDGWNQLRHGWEHRWPHALGRSQKSVNAALRSLGHGRKVGR